MKQLTISVIVLVLAVVFVGCATLPMESNVGKPIHMEKVTDNPVKSFSTSNKALWLFWGAIPISIPKLDSIVLPEMGNHSGVQNLKITTESDGLDVIVSIVTDGVLTMRTIMIEGEVYD